METQELHRGRLIDHIQLVVQDISASQNFYAAIFAALNVPMGGTGDGYFWADELFVTSIDSPAALGVLAGAGGGAAVRRQNWRTEARLCCGHAQAAGDQGHGRDRRAD